MFMLIMHIHEHEHKPEHGHECVRYSVSTNTYFNQETRYTCTMYIHESLHHCTSDKATLPVNVVDTRSDYSPQRSSFRASNRPHIASDPDKRPGSSDSIRRSDHDRTANRSIAINNYTKSVVPLKILKPAAGPLLTEISPTMSNSTR
jgi:hypothetical protein